MDTNNNNNDEGSSSNAEGGQEGGSHFVAWPEIVGLHIVRKNWLTGKEFYELNGVSNITYKGKIKLHGNNGGVVIREGDLGEYIVEAQSRNRTLSTKPGGNGDLAGFAAWTEKHKDAFIYVRKALKKVFPDSKKTVVFGEWCGMGIQGKVSLCDIQRKIFAVFSLYVDQGVISDPELITSFFPPALPENLHVLPWMTTPECGAEIELNYDDVAQMETQVPKVNALVERIDSSDPWVKEVFGVDGPGEGVVWYPVSLQVKSGNYLTVNHFERLAFKTKGEKHAVVKQSKPALITPEASAGVSDFVRKFVTPGRCEQGVGKVSGDEPITKAHTGKFVAWVTADVKKESATELEASKLTWKQVEKEVGVAARTWFLDYMSKK